MYSVVLMVAATSGGDVASFGKDRGGCNGCSGYSSGCKGGGFLGHKDRGGCNGGGFLGHKDKGGCNGGGCYGSSYSAGCHGTVAAGCTGTAYAPVVAAPMPAPAAPVAAVPVGCHGGGYST